MSGNTTLKPGDTLTAAQANALPGGSVVGHRGDKNYTMTRTATGWRDEDVSADFANELLINGHTLIRVGPPVAAPTNPHAPGSLAWARWAAQHEGACVRAVRSSTWAFRDGHYCCWSDSGKHWHKGEVEPFGDFKSHYGPWSIVPDPSAAETPVETSDERFAALTAQMVALKAERDELKSKNIALEGQIGRDTEQLLAALEVEKTLISERDNETTRRTHFECLAVELRQERGRLRTENADLLATAKMLKAERDASSALSDTYEAERDAAIQRAEKAEADWQAACSEHGKTLAELRAAKVVVPEDVRGHCNHIISRLQIYPPMIVCLAKYILSLTDHIAAVGKMAQSTHPEGTREWAEDAMRQGLSVVHGRSMSYWEIGTIGTSFVCSGDEHWSRWADGPSTGWRIHTPAVAPSAEPSVVKDLKATPEQLAAAIQRAESNMQNAAKWVDPKAQPPSVTQLAASIEERLAAVEAKVGMGVGR